MAQSKNEIEAWYENKDPWGYDKNPDDWQRRQYILGLLDLFQPMKRFYRALDIGCGEGFISDGLPASHIYGIEISDNAASRLKNTKRIEEPKGKYDLITACGVLYPQYEYGKFNSWIKKHASGIVLTSHYDQMVEMNQLPGSKQVFYARFPYREGNQILRVYSWKK